MPSVWLLSGYNVVDLTYRADLRELNKLNFARCDAKLEQRLAELRAELRQARFARSLRDLRCAQNDIVRLP